MDLAVLIIALVAVVAGVVLWVVSGKAHLDQDKIAAKVAAVLLIVVGVGGITLDSFTQIGAKNVGIVTSFGKPTGTLSNGLHWVAPWASITEIDGTVKNINRDKSHGGECITVRLQNQTTACVDVTAQWNISRDSAADLWQSYRTDGDFLDNIKVNVVERELSRSLNRAYENVNPLATIQNGVAPVKTDDIAQQVKADMIKNLPPGIVFDALLISITHYDDVTQSKLNAFAQAIADTQVALQQQKTNEAIAAANGALAQASSNDPGVKYANCLAFLRDLAAKGQLQNLQYGGFACAPADGSVIVGK